MEAIEAEGSGLVQLPLTVRSAEVWDRILDQPGGVTLLPLFEGADIGAAQTAVGRVSFRGWPTPGGQVAVATAAGSQA